MLTVACVSSFFTGMKSRSSSWITSGISGCVGEVGVGSPPAVFTGVAVLGVGLWGCGRGLWLDQQLWRLQKVVERGRITGSQSAWGSDRHLTARDFTPPPQDREHCRTHRQSVAGCPDRHNMEHVQVKNGIESHSQTVLAKKLKANVANR